MAIQLGVDQLLSTMPDIIRGRRVGLISNYTAVDGELCSTIDRFLSCSEFRLTTLFGPEHGVKNCAREGEPVAFEMDAHSRLPAYSLYGDTKKPTASMLDQVDVFVLDLQDIGSRYYTNMNTMALAMAAAAEHHKPFLVLDRPNPIGGIRQEGNILQSEFRSFVGGGPMPNRHGMTMGELARWFYRIEGLDLELHVMTMRGWKRSMDFEHTQLSFVSPSPNTTHVDMAMLYPGLCLFEGTNLSLGRGTTHPFEVVGAPFIDGHELARSFNQKKLAGVHARPTYFVPQSSPFQGELCGGVQLHITDRPRFQPVRSGIHLMAVLQERYPDDFTILPKVGGKPSFFQLLAGCGELEQWLKDGPETAGDRYLDQTTREWQMFRDQFEDVRLY